MSAKRVTGLGGIFFKCKDPEAIKKWYGQHLGIKTDEYGATFEFRKAEEPQTKAYAVWSPFDSATKYFEPSNKEFMINYRVENLSGLIEQLKAEGVEIIGEIEVYDFGKFAHILDPEGNKIELWEPVDEDFNKMVDGKTTF